MDLAEAKAILKSPRERLPTPEDEAELSPLEQRFSEEYVFGDFAGNQQRSYSAVTGNPNLNVCSANSSDLMKQNRVRSYINSLRRQRRELLVAEYESRRDRSWDQIARLARQVLTDAVLGFPITERQLTASIYCINRCEGVPVSRLEVDVISQERISIALRRFSARNGKFMPRARLSSGEVEVGEVVEAIPEREAS